MENNLLERVPETPRPQPVPAPSAPRWIQERIFFPFRGAEPRNDAHYNYAIPLAAVVRILRDQPSWRVRIVGHADRIGEAAANVSLSRARADAVKAELVVLGIAADRLSTEGAGMLAPIATNATEEGRALNRRVEFIVD